MQALHQTQHLYYSISHARVICYST